MKELPGPVFVVKSQIHAGGRGKGRSKELGPDAKVGQAPTMTGSQLAQSIVSNLQNDGTFSTAEEDQRAHDQPRRDPQVAQPGGNSEDATQPLRVDLHERRAVVRMPAPLVEYASPCHGPQTASLMTRTACITRIE